jgi:hypothetical protein
VVRVETCRMYEFVGRAADLYKYMQAVCTVLLHDEQTDPGSVESGGLTGL